MAPVFQMFSVLGEEFSQQNWVVDFLLPNGVMITHTVDKESSLAYIKEGLWKKAQEYPLHAKLKSKNSYVFSCINQMAARVQLVDECVRLCDVGLFQPMLKLDERKPDSEENKLKLTIGTLIGKGLHDFDALKSVEVSNFRINKKKMCEKIASERDHQEWLPRVMYLYPPDIADQEDIPQYLIGKIADNVIKIRVRIENATAKFTINMRLDVKATDMMPQILQKISRTQVDIPCDSDQYCLKVINRQEFLLGDYPLHRFTYIRSCLANDELPELTLVQKSGLLEEQPPKIPVKVPDRVPHHMPGRKPPPSPKPSPVMSAQCLWKVKESLQFEITLNSVSNVNLPTATKVKLRACLYHGLDPAGSVVNSEDAMIKDGFAEWNQKLTFDLKLIDLPRMARLCFLLYACSEKRKDKKSTNTSSSKVIKKGKQELSPVAWVNIPVFDFQGILHTGSQILYMWLLANDDCLTDTALNPIGTTECNPDTDAVQLKFTFSNYNIGGPICFPAMERVLEVAAENTKNVKPVNDIKAVQKPPDGHTGVSTTLYVVDDTMKEQLRHYIDKDPLCELTENDKEVIWNLRRECLEYFPHSLPKVLDCVQWADHIKVALMHALLQIWRKLPVEYALELLDFRYPDMEVRRFAVRCLQNLSDKQLIQYLLQLVQVLKYEPYLECELVNFLLKRALNNQRIGHNLFWLLRSEMHVPSVSVRFGLILEAYCYGNRNHLKAINKQVEALKKMRLVNDSVKHMTSHEKLGKEDVQCEMRKLLANNLFIESLSGFISFLDPGCVLGQPRIDECKVMDSKMKPLWMVWSHPENDADSQYMLFKKGDDLRQDMLTLQILTIMDDIWKLEGLDLRLNAYKCMSTGHNEGMIGIVAKAKTIAYIQKKFTSGKFMSAFSPTCLYDWLKERNPDPTRFEKALDQFTMSCVGCCVATYVLGIGDRHSDNILLCENGQLVHIDFGHILGHFKSKMGFKRERVPFVLTADFIYLIQRGPKHDEKKLKCFQELCMTAYMVLRRKSHFLITLFMMMTNTGIPELSSLHNIEFLRKTLVPHYSDKDANNHWNRQYSEALKNSFWAAVNFAFHNVAKDH